MCIGVFDVCLMWICWLCDVCIVDGWWIELNCDVVWCDEWWCVDCGCWDDVVKCGENDWRGDGEFDDCVVGVEWVDVCDEMMKGDERACDGVVVGSVATNECVNVDCVGVNYEV